MCFTATQDTESADGFNACDLFINAEVPGLGFKYLKIESVSPLTDNASKAAPQTDDNHIENEHMLIEYLEQDVKDRAIFNITDKNQSKSSKMAFSLQYYNPSTGEDGCPSGAYIFKPKLNDMDKQQYSNFVKIETFKTESTGVN